MWVLKGKYISKSVFLEIRSKEMCMLCLLCIIILFQFIIKNVLNIFWILYYTSVSCYFGKNRGWENKLH